MIVYQWISGDFNIPKHVEKSCTKKFQLPHICSLKTG